MEKLITVRDVSERYGCSLPTARKYIRQCNPHMENPLTTTEMAFRDWEQGRTVVSVHLTLKEFNAVVKRQQKGRVIVPRKREG